MDETCEGCKYRHEKLMAVFNGTPGLVIWCKLFNTFADRKCGYFKESLFRRLFRWRK